MWMSVFIWSIFILLLGLLMAPLTNRLFSRLADRGTSLARPVGLLLWGYLFWLMASLGLVENTTGGALVALTLAVAISFWVGRGRWQELRVWARQQGRAFLLGEATFLLCFIGWAIVRSVDPAIIGTEKPMEMAFINAILRSPAFPPHDPWLSGYAISYYYFGYVIVALIIRVTGVLPEAGFNLASALWFAMTAQGAFCILYNLLAGRKNAGVEGESKPKKTNPAWGLLAPLFLLLVSNWEGFFEMLHSRGIFWRMGTDGAWQSGFWKWLDIQELVNPPTLPFSWVPERATGIWWWRASRVLQDYNLTGQSFEIIDEFPFFSYLLSDLHPHVLAMPFALVGIALALNLFLQAREKLVSGVGLVEAAQKWLRTEAVDLRSLAALAWMKQPAFWAAALAMGGLSFLNTWDFPIYVALFSAAWVYRRYRELGWSGKRVMEFVELAVLLGVAGGILYLPFYLGFASQAGGVLPSMSFFTRGVHFWVMFGPFLVPIILWLVWRWKRPGSMPVLRAGIKFALLVIAGLFIVSYVMGFLVSNFAIWGNLLANGRPDSHLASVLIDLGNRFNGLQGASRPVQLVFSSLAQRIVNPGTWITLGAILLLVWGLLAERRRGSMDEDVQPGRPTGTGRFVMLLVLVGAGLALAPEYFYLRDQFGWRMNTIFKLYFQTWLLWSLAASFAAAVLWQSLRGASGVLFRVGMGIVLVFSLAYSFFGLRMRLGVLDPAQMTLDGSNYIRRGNADEMQAIEWLRRAPYGVVSEAVGGSYSGFARISTYSGLPTVLGWPGHESQWRGGGTEMGSRQSDIERLYRTSDWTEAQEILNQYQIRYVYVGGLERSAYRVNESKFQSYMKPVYQNATVTIYEVIPSARNVEQPAG